MAFESRDVVELVLAKLQYQDLGRCSMVSRLWRSIADMEKRRSKLIEADGSLPGTISLRLVDLLGERPDISVVVKLPDPASPPIRIKPYTGPSRPLLPANTLYWTFRICSHRNRILLHILPQFADGVEEREMVIFGDPVSNTWECIPGLGSQYLGFVATSAAFSHDGKLLLVCDTLKNTAVLDMETKVWSMGYTPEFEDLKPGQDYHPGTNVPKLWDKTDPLHEVFPMPVWCNGAFYACIARMNRGVGWDEYYQMHVCDDRYGEYNFSEEMWCYHYDSEEVCLAKFSMEEMRWREVEVELPEGFSWKNVRNLQLVTSSDATKLLVFVHEWEHKICTARYDEASKCLVRCDWLPTSLSTLFTETGKRARRYLLTAHPTPSFDYE